ncbi:class I SAM-dependent methyltransferase [Roseofilum reptotaenium CS-1145]|uniref:Methyltransferase domain-containing protein n=1 Tax=Roseofilum reptotaenium AO1-A TaxID=1925591 RepID=A0A1L9QU00_9CYAN|nr:class I SAM-dependent methyltransferase [Roseofilum reptotaenium]MDB9518360.1 class I SAM-dependent methyltransferase [Roseofilum reptotaenium CS-1145]OJJ26144.1 hypothetical protein BI308_08155 [Roseofilum reptotaenium AO1-A]
MYKIKKLYGSQQGDEFFELELADGERKTVNIWDYSTLYSYPHLYEYLILEQLECKVYLVLEDFLSSIKDTKQWRILDIACGSGLMGKFLKTQSSISVELLIGIDILPIAITALHRDNPHIYDQTYIVGQYKQDALKEEQFNCLIVSGGANHLEISDYESYLDLLQESSYLIFNLTNNQNDRRRMEILQWINARLNCRGNIIYEHRKLMNGSSVKPEAFIYQK